MVIRITRRAELFSMKPILVSAIILVSVGFHALGADDILITASRTKADVSKDGGTYGGVSESKEVAYSVKVMNKSFSELKEVTIKYNIYFEDATLGSRSDPKLGVVSGSHVFPSLLSNKWQDFPTKPVTLEKEVLPSNTYFVNRASSQAKDRVVGVWIKAFDSSGKQIGELANPSTISKKQLWKD